MNILLINNFDYIRGGSDRVFLETAILLNDKGHNVAIFSATSQENTPFKLPVAIKRYTTSDALDSTSNNLFSKARAFLKNKQALQDLEYCITDFCPDVAHLHIFQSRLSSFIVKTLSDRHIPSVMTVHEYKMLCPAYTHLDRKGNICEQCNPKSYLPCVTKKCVEGSLQKSILMAMESYTRDQYASYTEHINKFLMPSQFILNKHLAKFPEHKDKFIRRKYFINADTFQSNYVFGDYLLYFGRLSYVKGVKTLLQAAKQARHIPIKIAGTGPISAELQQFKKDHHIDNVSFVGFQKGKDLFKLISHARATIVPSEWFENFPLSIIESLAMGRPVIGAKIGGIPEQVINHQTGFLFESGKVDELQLAIQRLWQLSKEEHLALSKSCRQFALKEYHMDTHYQQLMKIFQEVIGKRTSKKHHPINATTWYQPSSKTA